MQIYKNQKRVQKQNLDADAKKSPARKKTYYPDCAVLTEQQAVNSDYSKSSKSEELSFCSDASAFCCLVFSTEGSPTSTLEGVIT